MATKKALVERIILKLTGGSQSKDSIGKYDERVIALDVDSRIASVLRGRMREAMRSGEEGDFLADCLTPYTVTVQTDATRNRKYAVIPASYLQLPNGKGIYSVEPLEDPTNPFIPVTPASMFMFSDLEADDLEGRIGYWPEGKKIWFNDNFSGPIHKYEQLLVRLVVATSGLAMDDEFPIGSDVEDEVITSIVNDYRGLPPIDKVNDNNATL